MHYQSRRAAQRTSQLLMIHLHVYSIGFDSADSNTKHAKPSHAFLLSKAMRSAIHARDGRRPPGLRRTEWPMQRLPTNLSCKLQHQPKDHTWNLVLSKTGRVSQPTVPPVHRTGRVLQPTGSASVSRHLCTRWCAICGAPDPSFCWCGASLVPTMHETTYEQLADFYYSPRNPLATIQIQLISERFRRPCLTWPIEKQLVRHQ